MINPGSLTVVMQLIAGLSILLLIPLFEFKLPSNIHSYIFLFIACIFYALSDRGATSVRKHIESSLFTIIKQLSNVFIIFIGLLIFKEEFILTKVIGAFLIIISNIFIFYKKDSFKNNKYIYLGLLSTFFLTIALYIDISYSNEFSLPIYIAFTLLVPAILIFIFERIKIKDIFLEYKNSNKIIILSGISWGIMMLTKLYAYQLGDVILVAPICSLNIIINVFVAYFTLKEKDNVLQKIVGAIIIILGIILIKL